MKATLTDISPKGIYTGAQAIRALGISSATFYKYVKEEIIPKHIRKIDKKPVYLGNDLLRIFQETEMVMPIFCFMKPKRGRPPKKKTG